MSAETKQKNIAKPSNPVLRIKHRYDDAKSAVKEQIINNNSPSKDIDISRPYEISSWTLGQYVTLDWQHRGDIRQLMRNISAYADDKSRRRPLNIIMQAEPGSGKSHFIKCLAKAMGRSGDVNAVTFNMAALQSIEDLIQPLDSVRNLKVIDCLPILFLDEFDSDPLKYPLLLPLLWDGELHIGHRDLKLGKVVIILASSGTNIETIMKTAKSMHQNPKTDENKIIDLLSRINGGEFSIPSLELIEDERDRRVDKVCIAISLLQQRFGQLLEMVPWALLRFVVDNKFRYGVRSITHLIDLIPSPENVEKELTLKDLELPIDTVKHLKESSLAYHIIADDGPAAVIETWKKVKECDVSVRIKTKADGDIPF